MSINLFLYSIYTVLKKYNRQLDIKTYVMLRQLHFYAFKQINVEIFHSLNAFTQMRNLPSKTKKTDESLKGKLTKESQRRAQPRRRKMVAVTLSAHTVK